MTNLIVALIGASSSPASAQQSADIELVRPVLSPDAPVGVDGMAFEAPGTVRIGLLGQYLSNPLVLEQQDADELQVVGSRAAGTLVVSADVGERVGVRAILPAAVSWGSSAPGFSADGLAIGDLSGGVRAALLRTDAVGLGLHADLTVPTGTRDAWLGEAGIRLGGGASATVRTDAIAVSGAVGGIARRPVDNPAQLRLGSQLYGNLGVLVPIVDVLAAQAAATSRFGFSPGTNAAEGLIGVQLAPSAVVAVDLLVGHGLTNGIGATDARLAAGVTVRRLAPAEQPRPIPTVIDDFTVLPEELEDEADEDEAIAAIPPEPEWRPQELARVARGEVELRDPIQFQVGTKEILPESQGILEQVAAILQTTPEIVHVVIVGHASNEGSFEVNYALSLERAASVYEALLRRGVHPDRLSVRAMGEVTPAGTPADELARRVEFRITRALGANETPPTYDTIDRLPFDGQARPGGAQ